MKYKLGDTVYYIESGTNYNKRIPCPMCFGKRFVTIILGDDSQTKSACGFCERGLEGSTGVATTWEPRAEVLEGTVDGISTRDGIKYEVGRRSISEHGLFDNKALAEEVCAIKFEEEKSRADRWYKESFINCTKKQSWSAGYHRNQIKDHERKIEWHQYRLGIIKDREPAAPQKGRSE